jgi:hypothetical protein
MLIVKKDLFEMQINELLFEKCFFVKLTLNSCQDLFTARENNWQKYYCRGSDFKSTKINIFELNKRMS